MRQFPHERLARSVAMPSRTAHCPGRSIAGQHLSHGVMSESSPHLGRALPDRTGTVSDSG